MAPRKLRSKGDPPPRGRKDDSTDSDTKSGKRQVVSTACIPCRRRKSKCDGAQPACSTCTAVYRTPCAYDVDSDSRRPEASQRQTPLPQPQNDALDVIIASLRTLPESEAMAVLRSLRTEMEAERLADTLRTNVNLPPSFGHQTLEADFSEQLARTPSHSRARGQSVPNLWESPTDEHGLLNLASWFRTAQDTEFVEHLLDLHFSWIHPFHQFFSREYFIRDMQRGRDEFCSVMLVNAVLAFACHYSDRPMARTNPRYPSTAGDEFFAVAKEELDSSDTPCLTTVQALGIMSIRETSRGRDSSGYQYAGRCVRMALEMGLHLSLIGNGLRTTENEIRKITFWGVFNLETTISVCVGRVSQLPRQAADVLKPTITQRTDMQDWVPYVDVTVSPDINTQQPGYTIPFLIQLSRLSELASDMVGNFYAPREPSTSRRLTAAHAQYTEWYENLPSVFELDDSPMPHVVVLHMYYHACVLHLFRPFIKLDLSRANLFPRETCTTCANTISELMDTLRSTYGLRRTCQLVPSLVLSASTIHLLNLPSEESSAHLRQSVSDLQTMSMTHGFAARCVAIIDSLATRWNVALPERARPTSLPPYDPFPSPSLSNFWTASIPQLQSLEQSRDMSPLGSSGSELSYFQPAQQVPFQTVFDTGMAFDVDTTQQQQQQNVFWTPFPSQTMPVFSTSTRWTSVEEYHRLQFQEHQDEPHFQHGGPPQAGPYPPHSRW